MKLRVGVGSIKSEKEYGDILRFFPQKELFPIFCIEKEFLRLNEGCVPGRKLAYLPLSPTCWRAIYILYALSSLTCRVLKICVIAQTFGHSPNPTSYNNPPDCTDYKGHHVMSRTTVLRTLQFTGAVGLYSGSRRSGDHQTRTVSGSLSSTSKGNPIY